MLLASIVKEDSNWTDVLLPACFPQSRLGRTTSAVVAVWRSIEAMRVHKMQIWWDGDRWEYLIFWYVVQTLPIFMNEDILLTFERKKNWCKHKFNSCHPFPTKYFDCSIRGELGLFLWYFFFMICVVLTLFWLAFEFCFCLCPFAHVLSC